MPNLICRGVSFSYDGAEHAVFNDLNLVIDTNRRTALVGANGRGKTTLLKLLAGALAPDDGAIERPLPCTLFTETVAGAATTTWEAAKQRAGPFLALEAQINALLDAGDEASLARYGELEASYRNLGGYDVDTRLERELTALGLTPRQWPSPLNTLSGGEQTRCQLAGLFAARGYPLIDEPTNHLDLDGRQQLAAYLATKAGFLLVSHDRAFVDAATEQLIALNRDTVEHHRLSFTAWRETLRQRLAAQASQNAELRKEIRQLDTAARARRAGAAAREDDKRAGGRTRQPSERGGDTGFIGARAARQMKRALAAEQRAERAAQARRDTLVDVEKDYPLKLPPALTPPTSRSPMVRCRDVTIVRGGPLFEPVTFEIAPGERLALQGPNGCGKSSLLALLAGDPMDHRGAVTMQPRLKIQRVCQQPRWTQGLLRTKLATAEADEARFRQIMAALGVRGQVLDQPLEHLSQGQLRKVELARAFTQPAHLLLWDEPLNYLDVETRERVAQAMLQTSAGMLFVEHDERFVDAVATRRVRLVMP